MQTDLDALKTTVESVDHRFLHVSDSISVVADFLVNIFAMAAKSKTLRIINENLFY